MPADPLLIAQQLTDIEAALPRWTGAAVAIAVVLIAALVLGEIAARLTRAALGALDRDPDTKAEWSGPLLRREIRLVRATVFVIVAALMALPALEVAGIETAFGPSLETLSIWFFGTGLRILVIAVLAYVVARLIALLVARFEASMSVETGVAGVELARRARTLGALIQRGLTALVVGVAVLMILRQLQFDIMPVLTGAGIVGLAIGFGAQTLVKDVISGFFMIFENQIRVGDVANINGTGGSVESITLRTIVLRDLSGTVHVFPNGSITTLANLTKDFSFYVVDVGVAYRHDTDEVAAVLTQVGEELAADPRFAADILGSLEILGVDSFGPSEVVIKIRIKTVPLRQWTVGRELRRRIKRAFDAHGIEIPYPHLSIYAGEATRPWPVRMETATVIDGSPSRSEGGEGRPSLVAPGRGVVREDARVEDAESRDE